MAPCSDGMKTALILAFLMLSGFQNPAFALDLATQDESLCRIFERRGEEKLSQAKDIAAADDFDSDAIWKNLKENNPPALLISDGSYIEGKYRVDLDDDGLPENLIVYPQGRAQSRAVLIYNDDGKIKLYPRDNFIDSEDDSVRWAELGGIYIYRGWHYLAYLDRETSEVVYISAIRNGKEKMLCHFSYQREIQTQVFKNTFPRLCRYAAKEIAIYSKAAPIESVGPDCLQDPWGSNRCAQPLNDYGIIDIDNDGKPDHVLELDVMNSNVCGYKYLAILDSNGRQAETRSAKVLQSVTGRSDCEPVNSVPFRYEGRWYIENKFDSNSDGGGVPSGMHDVYFIHGKKAELICDYSTSVTRHIIR